MGRGWAERETAARRVGGSRGARRDRSEAGDDGIRTTLRSLIFQIGVAILYSSQDKKEKDPALCSLLSAPLLSRIGFVRRVAYPSFCSPFCSIGRTCFLIPQSTQRAVKPILMGKDCIAQAQSGERQNRHRSSVPCDLRKTDVNIKSLLLLFYVLGSCCGVQRND